MEAEILPSNKDGFKLLFEGYSYHKINKSKEVFYWVCDRRMKRDPKTGKNYLVSKFSQYPAILVSFQFCEAKMKSTLLNDTHHRVIEQKGDHQCTFMARDRKKEKIHAEIRKAAECGQPPLQVIQQVTANLDQETLVHAPTDKAMTRTTQR